METTTMAQSTDYGVRLDGKWLYIRFTDGDGLAVNTEKAHEGAEAQLIREITGLEDEIGAEYTCTITEKEMLTLIEISERAEKVVVENSPKKELDTPIDRAESRAEQNIVSGLSESAIHHHTRNSEDVDGERRLRSAQALVRMSGQRMYTVDYDIKEGNENPSLTMWRAGCFRSTKSVWIVPEEALSNSGVMGVFADAEKLGNKLHKLPIDPSATAELVRIARANLQEYLIWQHTSLIGKLESASIALGKAEEGLSQLEMDGKEVTEKDRRSVQTLHVNRVRTTLKTAVDRFKAALVCAERYDLTEDVADVLTATREAIRAEVAAFNTTGLVKLYKPSPTI